MDHPLSFDKQKGYYTTKRTEMTKKAEK